MRFEEALKCMREGKLVMRPTHLVPRTMKNGKIVEVYTKFNGKLGYEPLDTMNTCNIIAGDWEIVNEKAQDNEKKSHNAEENKPKSEKNLTEQWKKGELPSGWYYYKSSILGNITIADSFTLHKYRNRLDWKDIITVLTPVPSYEEWKRLQSSWVDEMDKATRFKKALDDVCEEYNSKLPILEVENDKLKELLKECYKMLAQYHIENSEPSLGENIQLLTKIDEVLK